MVTPFTDDVARGAAAGVGERGTGLERLRAMAEAVLAVCIAHDRAMSILHYSWPQIRDSEDLAALVETNAEIFDRWQQVIADGVADGSVRADVDPVVATRLVTERAAGHRRPRALRRPGGPRGAGGFERLLADLDAVVLQGLAAEREVAPTP